MTVQYVINAAVAEALGSGCGGRGHAVIRGLHHMRGSLFDGSFSTISDRCRNT
ncbi:MAG: hypothetical protein QOJ19_956 [Acidimicrobiia bacterium]|jgi:hypothetical protein|nr:hypothetical protein [Acidimicrobiia bacterium]